MDLPIGTYHTIIPINSTYLPRYSTHHKHKAVSAISVRVTLLKGAAITVTVCNDHFLSIKLPTAN